MPQDPVYSSNNLPLFSTIRSIVALMLREMATTYGKSAGGYIWVVLEPVLGIALLSIVFSLAFRSPNLGSNFAIFYATGYLPYFLYMDISRKVGSSINFSRPLLTYPAVTFMDAILARFLLNLITHIVVFYILIVGIELVFRTNTIHNYGYMVSAIAMAAALGMGIGSLNCFLWSIFPAWERMWGILNKPLFIISGVLYVYEDIPAAYQKILWFNPVIHITAEMRKGFYPTYRGDFISPLYIYGISFTAMVIGFFLLLHYHKRIVA
jgi:capsular polysaccharide transport system permease protein